MAVEIGSRKELEEWLEFRPDEWAQVLSLRAALRVFPHVADPWNWERSRRLPELTVKVLRSLLVSSAATEIPVDYNVRKAADLAAFFTASYERSFNSEVTEVIACAQSASGAAVTLAMRTKVDAARTAAYAVAKAASVTDAGDTIWEQLGIECRALKETDAPEKIAATPLWKEKPDWFQKTWGRAARELSASRQGFEIWREWYYGRIEGLPHAFADFDDAADEAFYRWIIEQDNDWWSREPAEVNADIKAKVDSLRTPIERPEARADFFISHAQGDTATLNDLITVLDLMGKTYILPQRGGTKGQSYKAIERADRVIALYSDGYVQSDECADEWMHSYYLDASTAEQRMLAFRLDRADLKPLMNGLSFCDLTRLLPDRRKQAMAKWIEWKPRALTRENVEQTLTTHLDPGVIASADGKLDTAPDAVLNAAELPSELASAMDALRMMLDLARLNERNLSSMMQSSLRLYDDHFTQYGRDSSWRGLDRYIKVLGEGAADLSSATMREEKAALEQLIAAHGECFDALASADEQTRELANVPVKDDSPDAIESLIDNLKELQEKAREGDASTDKYDIEARNLVKQGREFAIEAGALNANEKPDAARKSFLRYVGGFGLKTLTVLASLATLRSTPENKRLTEIAEKLVEKFYEMVGL
ncbi:hypothetical protein EH31_03605 [Erythrobacter longus]|uniref:TIR domain-containing protein n=1 Tax=Erythrobacter longus TaxID=1044 RepID=A0A074ME53_ERYLO|nr:toll/interleukin-1 receptor domain-containing protein [Erythrobacter longus]KEO91769.1 hypothetical protein EH31_03605 [Erythrobacter longus]